MELTTCLLAILIGLIGFCFFKLREKHRYWTRKGVKSPTPRPFLGNSGRNLLFMETMGEFHSRFYKMFPGEPMIGFYSFYEPFLLLRDPRVIEKVLVKEFANFSDHGFEFDEEANPLEINLAMLNGNRWRALRSKLSPVFTTGKLRTMTPTMTEGYSRAFTGIGDGQEIDIREIFATYATIVFGTCVFGIETEEISKSGSEFRLMNRKTVDLSVGQMLRMMLIFGMPKLAKWLKIGLNSKEILAYFERIVVSTLDQRRRDPSLKRNDFVQTLLQLRDKGTLEYHVRDAEDDYLHSEHHHTTETFEMTDSLVVSQAVSFLSAGFEGVSLVMTYCCFELAKNPALQARLRAEIVEKIGERDGVIDYDTIKSMTLLDQCLQETSRLYPVAPFLIRVPVKDCSLEGVELDRGVKIIVPLMAIQRDPAFYPRPEVFDPDRFAPGAHRTPFTFLSFGEGPRMCIGMRFALLEMKIGVALAVRDFEMKLSPGTSPSAQFSRGSFILSPKEKLVLEVKRVKPSSG